MKKLFLYFAIFLAILIIGCQENSITNPVSSSILEKFDKTNNSILQNGVITLDGLLANPYPVMNSYFLIDGTIDYIFTMHENDPIAPDLQNVISIDLSTTAALTGYCTVCEPPLSETSAGTLKYVTNDQINLVDGENYELIKSYLIQGRDDGMLLMCKFLFTPENISLSNMWLELNSNEIGQLIAE